MGMKVVSEAETSAADCGEARTRWWCVCMMGGLELVCVSGCGWLLQRLACPARTCDGGRWLDAPAGSTGGNVCSIVLQMQRGIADRSGIPCFIFKHNGKCVPTAPGKREQGSKQCCSLAVRSDVALRQCAGPNEPFTRISSELFKYSI